jgi:DNA polymerase
MTFHRIHDPEAPSKRGCGNCRKNCAAAFETLEILRVFATLEGPDGEEIVQIDLFDTELNAILSAPDYATFADRVRRYDCRRCPLCHSRSRIVVDRGNPEASVMVISERPGDREDAIGQAFVGRAGEMLDKMFAAIGLDSNRDLLITNVVKCKPETDRAPVRDEVDACLPFLERQIALVKPRVGVLLGAVALKALDPKRGEVKMEEEAGRFFELPRFPGIQWVVFYHPAFLLRDPSKKVDAWAHLKALKRFLEGGDPEGKKEPE